MTRSPKTTYTIAATLLALSPFALSVSKAQTPVQTPAKRPMTFTDLMSMKRVADPQISPSGKWVLFSVTEVSLSANNKTNHLWIVPLSANQPDPIDGSKTERQLTLGKANETNGRLSPDGHWLLYTSDANGASQLWLAPWNESTGELGSPRNAITSLNTEADGAIWSPDSHHILFTSSVYPQCSTAEGVVAAKAALATPETYLASRTKGAAQSAKSAELHRATWPDEESCNKALDEAADKDPVKAQIWTSLLYRHWNRFTGEKRSHILLAEITDQLHPATDLRDLTPATDVGDAETPTFSLGGPLGYAWSPDSKEIAYVTNLDPVPATSTNNDIFTLSLTDANAKPQKISTSPGSDDGPQYSPDGKYLAFRSQARNGFESDRFRLMLYNRQTRQTTDLLSTVDTSVDEFRWGPRSAVILFTCADKGETPISVVAVQEHSAGMHEMRTFPSPGEFADLQISTGYTIVASRMLASQPAEIVAIESPPPNAQGILAAQRTVNILSHTNQPLLSQLSLAPLEPFWFPGANNTNVQGFLIRPPNFDPNKKYPLKFLIHGGPQGAWGDSWSYRWNAELMAADGYVVVMINPRGSTGYGQQFINEVSGDWGGRAYQDLMLGLDYAEQHFPFIDKTRECALGASYGGYMADWVLTHTNRFQCIVTHDGMSDPASAFGTTEELWFAQWEFRPLAAKSSAPNSPHTTVEQAAPANPWDFYDKPAAQDPFRRWSPMLAIKNAKTPTLIIHGQRDYRLDVSQGLELFTALQLRGVPSKFLYFPDEGHWVLKPQNSQLWYKTVNDWCDRWTHTNSYATPNPTPQQAPPKQAPKSH